MTTGLIDIETPVYRLCCSNETKLILNGKEKFTTDIGKIKTQINSGIASIQKALNTKDVVLFFGGKENFRKTVLPDYKANRATLRKPLGLQEIREYLLTNYGTIVHKLMEADDSIGIVATSGNKVIKGEKIVVSIDKDMKQIPGLLLNPDKDTKPVRISVKEANRYFYRQILIGDATDNYKGCPKVGVVGALKTIKNNMTDEAEMWELVVNEFIKKGLTEGDALKQARCARILRASDYNFETKEINLWQPIRK